MANIWNTPLAVNQVPPRGVFIKSINWPDRLSSSKPAYPFMNWVHHTHVYSHEVILYVCVLVTWSNTVCVCVSDLFTRKIPKTIGSLPLIMIS